MLNTVTIIGQWSIADSGTLSFNGNLVDSLSSSPWTSLHSLTVPTADLNPGLNTVTMTVTQSDNLLEAARFEGTISGTPAPEPATAGLLALGGFAVVRRRHTR